MSVLERLPHLLSWSPRWGPSCHRGSSRPLPWLVVSWGFSVLGAPPPPCFHIQLVSPDRPESASKFPLFVQTSVILNYDLVTSS